MGTSQSTFEKAYSASRRGDVNALKAARDEYFQAARARSNNNRGGGGGGGGSGSGGWSLFGGGDPGSWE